MTSKYGVALGPGGGRLNWTKIVDDLHTGKVLGGPGKVLVDATSLVIIALTLTGIYLWGVPFVRKRRGARERHPARAARPEIPAGAL